MKNSKREKAQAKREVYKKHAKTIDSIFEKHLIKHLDATCGKRSKHN